MIYVPVYVAVDTTDPVEAIECAKVVSENTAGESFHLVILPPEGLPDIPVIVLPDRRDLSE